MKDTEEINRGGAMSHTQDCACFTASFSDRWKCAVDCPGCTCNLRGRTLGERAQSPNLCRVGKQHCNACIEKDVELRGLRHDLDKIAKTIYPDEEYSFTYSVNFIVDEIKQKDDEIRHLRGRGRSPAESELRDAS